jgi:hypothetical protein
MSRTVQSQNCCRFTFQEAEDSCSIVFQLHAKGTTSPFSTDPDASSADHTWIAATGSRKDSKAHWKYVSSDSFIRATDKPWSSIGLQAFRATSKVGVLAWLKWIVEHTPAPGTAEHAVNAASGDADKASTSNA